MKVSIFIIALVVSISANAQKQSVGNSKINTDFTKYKTFTWSSDGVNDVLHNSIYNELEGHGFRESSNGDLIVSYRVLDKKGKIRGYVNDYPTVVISGKEVRKPSDTITYSIAPGTVVISLVDAKTDEAVWSGFASGVVQSLPEQDAIATDELQLREAVHSIFEKFKYSAEEVR